MSHTSTSTKPVLDAGATVPGPEFSIDARGEIAQRRLARTEWVLTIGNGGFAMGTAIGTPRRRFHGLFVPALKPPVSRITALQQMHETIVLRPGTDLEEKIELGSYELVGQPAEEPTSPHLIRFEKDRTAVRWVYEVREVEIIKELRMGFRSSECAVRYAIRANAPCQLRVRPLVSLRAFDQLHGAGKVQRFQVDSDERLCTVRAPTGGEDPNSTQPKYALNLMSDSGSFQESIELLRGVRYEFETERGEEQGVSDWEDLFVPGRFVFSFEGGPAREEVMIAHSIGNIKPNTGLFEERTAQTYLEATIRRATEATPGLGGCAGLIIAADSFLVEREHRGETFMTVIAGYPWFADWGRDAMISLPGLMLSTGRLAEARHCLQTFARHLSRGMIPNNFDESAGPPGYNTVDAALWFLHSACRYLEISGDQKWFDDKLSFACRQVLEYYQTGTRYGISMDPKDGLIKAGDAGSQLTWMDAKRDDEVFTPRHGKAVEINALWYSGLLSIANAIEHTEPDRADRYRKIAERTREGFNEKFWDEKREALHDCIQPDEDGVWMPTGEIRPNQIFAVSLPFSPLIKPRQRGVIAEVARELLTPYGLRTLAPGSKKYQARFEGDMISRDRAYHNGTVWPWLIGPYAEALLRFGEFSTGAKQAAREAIAPLLESLNHGCIGQIAEVYDADEPRRPQGCGAQAWSVAEVLRIATLVG